MWFSSTMLDIQYMEVKLTTTQVWSFLKQIPPLDPTPHLEFLSHSEPPNDLALQSLIKSHSIRENKHRGNPTEDNYWYRTESCMQDSPPHTPDFSVHVDSQSCTSNYLHDSIVPWVSPMSRITFWSSFQPNQIKEANNKVCGSHPPRKKILKIYNAFIWNTWKIMESDTDQEVVNCILPHKMYTLHLNGLLITQTVLTCCISKYLSQ